MRRARRQGRIPTDSTEEGLAVVIRALILPTGRPIEVLAVVIRSPIITTGRPIEVLAVVIRSPIITMGRPIGTACLLFSTALVQSFVLFSRPQSRIRSIISINSDLNGTWYLSMSTDGLDW
jgi:hypothetical protein